MGGVCRVLISSIHLLVTPVPNHSFVTFMMAFLINGRAIKFIHLDLSPKRTPGGTLHLVVSIQHLLLAKVHAYVLTHQLSVSNIVKFNSKPLLLMPLGFS